jgi:hypothetical protein
MIGIVKWSQLNASISGVPDGTFNLKSDRLFTFLIRIRAGGSGIILIGAENFIIFDSYKSQVTVLIFYTLTMVKYLIQF